MRPIPALTLAGALLASLAGTAYAAPSAAQLCEAAAEGAAAKFAKCRLDAEAKNTKGTLVGQKFTDALGKCSTKLSDAFTKALAKYGAGDCPTEPSSEFDDYLTQCSDTTVAAAGGVAFPECGDDAINVAGEQCDGANLGGETCASLGLPGGTLGCTTSCAYDTSGCTGSCTSQLFLETGQTTCWSSSGTVIPCAGTGHDGEIRAGAPLTYMDNGNGTITDLNTGLMWEKLSDDGTIHDKYTIYNWGDAFAVKIASLNSGGGFAGHTDWRLPNRRELESIVNLQNVTPAVSAAFNTGCVASCTVTTCSCTVSSNYWSSSTNADGPAYAWYVNFYGGYVYDSHKTYNGYVRAVRGGS